MPNWLFATDPQTAEDLHNELLTSTTRKLGGKLRYEFQSSSRRRNGIEEELSRRIRLMEKIPGSHPNEIFVYNNKGFKAFTSKVKDILGRDLERKPQKVAVPKYLDYTRGMLKDEIEKEKKAQPILKEGAKGQEGGDDTLKEDYEQLVEEFGAMEAEHEQLIEKYKQLKKDHVQLQKEHERVLHELGGRKETQTKVPEQKTASAPDMRPRDEGPKRPQALGDKTLPPGFQRQDRGAQEAQEARERASAQAQEKAAREQQEAKIREWEEANFMKEMNKRERELREERAARERQRMRAPPKDLRGAERLDIQAEGSAPQVPRHSIHGGVFDSQPPPPTTNQELSQGQKVGYPNMPQYLPYQPKHASLRQANDSKSVSFDLPTKTPKKEQESPAQHKSDSLQQTMPSKSVSTGLPTGTRTMGQTFPAQQLHSQQPAAKQPPAQRPALLQPPVRQPPAQHPPVQQFPVQQRSAGLQAYDSRSFPYGLPTGTPDMGHSFPDRQKSAPLQQTNESRNVSMCLPTRTASTPTDLRAPRRQELPRSQEPPKGTDFDQGRAAERMDGQQFIRLLDPS
ncbi:hypothetical protein BDR22DRAFT_873165 [Usnea florida]